MDKDTEAKRIIEINLSDMDEETIAILLDDMIATGG